MFVSSLLLFILLWFLTKSILAAIIIDVAFSIILFVIGHIMTRNLFTRCYEPSGEADDERFHVSLYIINNGDNSGGTYK